MSTQDKTLLQFLSSFNLGEIKNTPLDVLQDFGHTEESASDVEIFMVDLNHPMEIGELPSLVASYVIRSGYERVTVTKQNSAGKIPKGFEIEGTFPEGSLVTGESGEQGRIAVIVSYSDKVGSFVKQITN